MGGGGAFLQNHGLYRTASVIQQFGWPQRTGDQHRFSALAQAAALLALSALLALMQVLQQAVGEILNVEYAFAHIGVGDLGHARAGIAQRLCDRGVGGQARADALANPGQPAAVFGEHAVGLQHLHMFLAGALAANLLHHFVERAMHALDRLVEPIKLGRRIFGDDLADFRAAFVDHRLAHRQPAIEARPFKPQRLERDAVGGGEFVG